MRSLVSREEVRAMESRTVVEQTFAGSLPGFLVSFLGEKPLSREEAEELKRMIDRYSE
jgi:predicted transcriptional regulator